jgi:two-component system chemotaxis sensor kinase CheA
VGAAGAPPSAAAPVASPLAGAEAAAAGQAAPVPDGWGEASLRSATQTVRVEIGRLDALMTIVGELALEKTVLAGIADHLKQAGGAPALASALTKASRSLEKRLTELQERVMEVRMVPLSQAFDKMARTVRKLSRDAGKEVDLVVSGADTKLDKLIVEEIVDPLMHITRNAIDHGIEPPGERQAAGKPVRGRIDLSAYQKGNHVVIEVADDGQGLDFDRVREVAVARGLLPDDGPPLKVREAFDLLCAPGFSTCDAVTEISGRGVGMDVVKTSIRRLSGVLDFETTRGRGTKMIITLPMTLAIIQALIVSGCGRTYAIPLNQVQENLMIAPGEIRTIDRREVIQLRERTLPIARLERLFRLEPPEGWRPGSSRGDGTLYVVVVGVGDLRMGLVVDELIGQQDVVVKSIGELLKAVRGIAGAADLGNQQTILVLDVGALIDEAIQLGAGRRGVG